MKEKNYSIFSKVKTSKPFYKSDLIIYLIVVFLLSILFFFLSIPKNNKTLGFSIIKDTKEIAYYRLSDKSITVGNEYKNLVSFIESKDGLTITIYTDESLKDYNVVFIDFDTDSIRVTDSTCSTSKDCVHTPPVKSSGVIVCVPHRLKIVAVNNVNGQPITG